MRCISQTHARTIAVNGLVTVATVRGAQGTGLTPRSPCSPTILRGRRRAARPATGNDKIVTSTDLACAFCCRVVAPLLARCGSGGIWRILRPASRPHPCDACPLLPTCGNGSIQIRLRPHARRHRPLRPPEPGRRWRCCAPCRRPTQYRSTYRDPVVAAAIAAQVRGPVH